MLSKRGISVILLDHRLKPIMELCERIFVLRQGRTVGVSTRCCFSENTIFSQMIGFLSTEPVAKKIEMPYQILPNIHLEFRNIFCEDLLNDISFKIHSREILGIINVDDPFGSIIPNILLGKILPESGSIFIDEKPFDVSDRKDPLISDIGFVIDPFYVFEELSIKENIVMPIMKKKSNSFGILNLSELKYLADELISEYIPSNDIKTLMNSRWKINGKIMKKIYLCKALAKDPKCVIFTNPTQYVDIASKKDIYRDIVSLKQKGKSALIISLSFDDLVSVCDRIIVIKNGSLKESFSFSEISENTFVEKYGKYLSQS
jgi:ABC-type sugar transport system ATPase subunit